MPALIDRARTALPALRASLVPGQDDVPDVQTSFDIAAIARDLGWTPRFPVEQGLAAYRSAILTRTCRSVTDPRLPDLSARLWAGDAPREDLVTRVCGALRAEIEARTFVAGSRLPSEAASGQGARGQPPDASGGDPHPRPGRSHRYSPRRRDLRDRGRAAPAQRARLDVVAELRDPGRGRRAADTVADLRRDRTPARGGRGAGHPVRARGSPASRGSG